MQYQCQPTIQMISRIYNDLKRLVELRQVCLLERLCLLQNLGPDTQH